MTPPWSNRLGMYNVPNNMTALQTGRQVSYCSLALMHLHKWGEKLNKKENATPRGRRRKTNAARCQMPDNFFIPERREGERCSRHQYQVPQPPHKTLKFNIHDHDTSHNFGQFWAYNSAVPQSILLKLAPQIATTSPNNPLKILPDQAREQAKYLVSQSYTFALRGSRTEILVKNN